MSLHCPSDYHFPSSTPGGSAVCHEGHTSLRDPRGRHDGRLRTPGRTRQRETTERGGPGRHLLQQVWPGVGGEDGAAEEGEAVGGEEHGEDEEQEEQSAGGPEEGAEGREGRV